MSSNRSQPDAEPCKAKKSRGFAAMSPEQQKELSRRGGKAAHRMGTAHKFDTAEAREAGRKGGIASHAKRRTKPAESPSS